MSAASAFASAASALVSARVSSETLAPADARTFPTGISGMTVARLLAPDQVDNTLARIRKVIARFEKARLDLIAKNPYRAAQLKLDNSRVERAGRALTDEELDLEEARLDEFYSVLPHLNPKNINKPVYDANGKFDHFVLNDDAHESALKHAAACEVDEPELNHLESELCRLNRLVSIIETKIKFTEYISESPAGILSADGHTSNVCPGCSARVVKSNAVTVYTNCGDDLCIANVMSGAAVGSTAWYTKLSKNARRYVYNTLKFLGLARNPTLIIECVKCIACVLPCKCVPWDVALKIMHVCGNRVDWNGPVLTVRKSEGCKSSDVSTLGTLMVSDDDMFDDEYNEDYHFEEVVLPGITDVYNHKTVTKYI